MRKLTKWLSGEIVQNDAALTFIWGKPPYRAYDDGTIATDSHTD